MKELHKLINSIADIQYIQRSADMI